MYYTEQEIMSQHEALQRTYEYLKSKKEDLAWFFERTGKRQFVLMGCGSSYMLAKSGQRLFGSYENTQAIAVAGGDFLVNPRPYLNFIKDSIVICLSRSGKTSEMVRSVERIKREFNCPILSVTMRADNALAPYADINLILDWCYDESVCQTRSVTNFYLAEAMLAAFYGGDTELEKDLGIAASENEKYKEVYRPILAEAAKKDWEKVVVLADGAACGVAEEGALAFAEISRLPGYYSNLLDYRHGPMVLNDDKTLNIILLSNGDMKLQRALVEDIKKRNGIVIIAYETAENIFDADIHIHLGSCKRQESLGIPFLFVMQILALEKALRKGCDPDVPEGLDAYITL